MPFPSGVGRAQCISPLNRMEGELFNSAVATQRDVGDLGDLRRDAFWLHCTAIHFPTGIRVR